MVFKKDLRTTIIAFLILHFWKLHIQNYFKRQSNGVANILGGQTGGNLICWGEMFPTTPNMFLSNNIHKNSIFYAFFKF